MLKKIAFHGKQDFNTDWWLTQTLPLDPTAMS